ncbi:MAG: DUF420 domain-containing protein [Planctomycetaceae bacterium]
MIALLNTRADLIVDLFLLLLILLLPVLLYGVRLARRGRLRAHAAVMGGSFLVFLAALLTFEIDVRLSKDLPAPAPLPFLVHMCFALPALFVWVLQLLRRAEAFTAPARHKRRGRLVLLLIAGTVATGTWLYRASYL